MDIDVLRVSGKNEWKRLDQLTRARSLTGEEIDELDLLYRYATTDLARVRTKSPDPDLIADLSRLLSAARGRLAGTSGLTGAIIARFFVVALPLAMYPPLRHVHFWARIVPSTGRCARRSLCRSRSASPGVSRLPCPQACTLSL